MLLLILSAISVVPNGEIFNCTPTHVWDGDGPIWCAEGPRIRHRIGAVLQDDRLLAGTIADNVSFFDADLDMAKVEECLAKACVLDDILKMPMGTMTLVGDLGSTLSGGQQQRVLLARALYREPTILFLDEGTANLDPETEAWVSETLRGLSCTRIFVAHREAAIAGADRTLLVAGGTVTELTEQVQVAAE